MTDDIVIESGGVGEGDGDVKVSSKKNLTFLKNIKGLYFGRCGRILREAMVSGRARSAL